jgi:hypothetical protein
MQLLVPAELRTVDEETGDFESGGLFEGLRGECKLIFTNSNVEPAIEL